MKMHKPRSRTLFLNFIRLLLVMFAVILSVTLFIYNNSRRILQDEMVSANENTVRSAANSMDRLFFEMRYTTAIIATNTLVRTYFTPDANPTEVFSGYYERIGEQISAYINGFDYLHSIYLYSPQKERYIDKDGEHSIVSLIDDGWLNEYSAMTERITIFPRKVDGRYPYVMTLINKVRVNNNEGVVVFNINLRKLPNILEVEGNNVSHLFIVDNDSQVLYRKNQEDLPENIQSFPELAPFTPEKQTHSVFERNAPVPYVYAQMASQDYGFQYVAVTYLPRFTERLSNQIGMLTSFVIIMILFSVGLAAFFSRHSYKPIRSIINLLESPEKWSAQQIHSTAEIKEIVERIISYIQMNSRLSQELNAQLHTLNETRMWALQSQINPHFINNTLNLIHLSVAESLGRKHTASLMTVELGKMLHFALDAPNLVTLRDELTYTRHFFAIINARFENRVETSEQIDTEAENVLIPKLILQPLVENAIAHGMIPQSGRSIKITIAGKLKDGQVILTVADNGVGMDNETLTSIRKSLITYDDLTGSHIGLKNVATRLKLLFKDQFSMEIDSMPGEGVIITLLFPLI
jgi:two-component system sensor histidine kinase YesM